MSPKNVTQLHTFILHRNSENELWLRTTDFPVRAKACIQLTNRQTTLACRQSINIGPDG